MCPSPASTPCAPRAGSSFLRAGGRETKFCRSTLVGAGVPASSSPLEPLGKRRCRATLVCKKKSGYGESPPFCSLCSAVGFLVAGGAPCGFSPGYSRPALCAVGVCRPPPLSPSPLVAPRRDHGKCLFQVFSTCDLPLSFRGYHPSLRNFLGAFEFWLSSTKKM